MQNSFTIRLTGEIEGEEIHPHTFDLSELRKLIDGLIKIIRIEVTTECGLDKIRSRLLSLHAIEDKCSALHFNSVEIAHAASSRIGSAICTGDFDILQDESQHEIRRIFNPLIEKGACIQWIGENTSPIYSKENPLPCENKNEILIEPQASLLVKVLKIGGIQRSSVKAFFEATGQELQAICDQKTCKKLSDEKCLYERVTLIGKAKWNRETWKLKSFHVNDFVKHYQGDINEFIDSLDPSFLNACNAINIDNHLIDLRDEDQR